MKSRFLNAKAKLLDDPDINPTNREWIRKFYEYQERKLKRQNHIPELDDGSYKTLYHYTTYFRNVIKWFENRPCSEWTADDLKRVYNNLEDGIILNSHGKPFKDRATYYDKMFKSKPFRMLGLEQAAKEIIEYTTYKKEDVSFVSEPDFRKIVDNTIQPEFKVLYWLLWDYGENIEATMSLRKNDFTKQTADGEPEYRVYWRKSILKRSRRERGAVNNYPETFKLLEDYLSKLDDNDKLFTSTSRNIRKSFMRSCKRAGVLTIPQKKLPTPKDLRSGMACYLLSRGLTREEVNNRLGHVPSSKEIDKYINFLAIDEKPIKKKVSQFKIEKLQDDFDEYKRKTSQEISRLTKVIENLMNVHTQHLEMEIRKAKGENPEKLFMESVNKQLKTK